MKIIFSRKGFDSAAGGVASPILPDGKLHSIPIPDTKDTGVRYADIETEDFNLGKLVDDLTAKKRTNRITSECKLHLDPDLNPDTRKSRPDGWKPIFGQVEAAQRHLHNQGVTIGDIFIYFGWFRRVEPVNGTYRFVSGAPNLHVIFGWLQIGQIIAAKNEADVPEWANKHPHAEVKRFRNNTLYIAHDCLALPGPDLGLPGGGLFTHFDSRLCLTAPDETRSWWKLPHWFYPFGPYNHKPPLSYHGNPKRWKQNDGSDSVLLKTVGRGQELVLDCDYYPEAIGWLGSRFKPARR